MTTDNGYFIGPATGYTPVFFAQWQDHEEWGWVLILEKQGRHYSLEGGYCLLSEERNRNTLMPLDLEGPLAEEELLQIMDQWQEDEEEIPHEIINACAGGLERPQSRS